MHCKYYLHYCCRSEWKRVNKLEKKKEELVPKDSEKTEAAETNGAEEVESEDSDLDLDSLMDWRFKQF